MRSIPEIDLRGAQGAALFIDDLHWFLDEELIEAMRPFETDFVAGRGFSGTQLSGERNATHALIRFRNPQVAQQAAAAMVQMDRTQSRPYAAGPGVPEAIPGHPEVQATRMGPLLTGVTTHNEYVVYVACEHKIHYPLHLVPELVPPWSDELWWDDTTWQAGYAARFFDTQPSMFDQIHARKTEDGFGTADDWETLDTQDMMPYVVSLPPEDKHHITPISMGPRAVVTQYRHMKELYEAMNDAGVDIVIVGPAYMYRTPDAGSAKSFADAAIDILLLEEGFEVGYEEYDEPQGVPDTRCVSLQTTEGRAYTCYLHHGRYVSAGVEYVATDTVDNESGKVELSQRMAAQYLPYEQMPEA